MEYHWVSQQSKDEMETETDSEMLEIRSFSTQLAAQVDFIEGFN